MAKTAIHFSPDLSFTFEHEIKKKMSRSKDDFSPTGFSYSWLRVANLVFNFLGLWPWTYEGRKTYTSGLANFQFRDSQFLKVKWRLSDKERITVKICILFVVMGNTSELSFLGNSNVVNSWKFWCKRWFFSAAGKKVESFSETRYKYRLFCRPFVWSSAACLHTHLSGTGKNERGFVSNGSFRVLQTYINLLSKHFLTMFFRDQLLKKGYTISLINHVRNL